MLMRGLVPVVLAAFIPACGSSEDRSLSATWKFTAGDCDSNKTATVRVTWGPKGGTQKSASFACSEGSGKLGEADMNVNYTLLAEGLDDGGKVRATSYAATVTFSGGTGGFPVDLTMHPAGGNVWVNWRVAASGDGCPPGVIMPYTIILYVPPATAGATPSNRVAEAYPSCTAGQAVLNDIAPGDYLLVLDNLATTPAIRGKSNVTVVSGEDAEVTMVF
jgi:hypothetical protein